ncbi:probable cytochrome P450 303a1 [Prorops nasuta]|uniref:probable cytochrome P450 303a1 n=1 Tax=Prorops nasuta TaxID=863751 RepID=UPI0034CD4CC2
MLSTSILFITLVLLLLYLGSRKPKRYPPGPKWWPVIGSALEVARLRRETGYLFKSCSELCKKYGPVVGLKIGADRLVILNSYESIKSMVANEDCDGRPIGPIYEARTWGKRRGLLVVDGKLWVEQRRFVLRHLREFGFGRTSMATIIEEEVYILVQRFKSLLQNGYNDKISISEKKGVSYMDNNNISDGQIYKLEKDSLKNKKNSTKTKFSLSSDEFEDFQKAEKPLKPADMYVKAEDYAEVRKVSQTAGMIISMHDAFGVSVLNTLWKMMAGKRYNTEDKELNYLQRILTKLLYEIDMIGAPFSHFPILKYLAPELSGYKPFVEMHQQLWKFLWDELESHKKNLNPNAPKDLMDAYLIAISEEGKHSTFSDSQLLAICVDLFMAGSETTAKTLGFCMMYLILDPSIQIKAHEEIDRVIGRDRFPTLNDRPRMPYVNAIAMESLRMFMGRTLNIPHRAVKDTSILGYNIPKDTMIVVNFNRVLMDDSWGDPEEFRPERFLDENGKLSVPDQFCPFSLGRHRCMGEVLAKSNVFLMIAAMLQSFNFACVPGEKKPSKSDFVDGVTAGPKPFKALVSLRT